MNAAVSLGSRSTKETEGRVGDRFVQGDLLDAHLEQLSCIRRRTEDHTVIVDGGGVVLDLVLLLLQVLHGHLKRVTLYLYRT